MPGLPADTGRAAEDQALAYLQQRGLRLVARNVRNKLGELDLVMREHATLVIVEVRARRSAAFGDAAASVDARKQGKLLRATARYLQETRLDLPVRFDVVAITGRDLNWVRDAFRAE